MRAAPGPPDADEMVGVGLGRTVRRYRRHSSRLVLRRPARMAENLRARRLDDPNGLPGPFLLLVGGLQQVPDGYAADLRRQPGFLPGQPHRGDAAKAVDLGGRHLRHQGLQCWTIDEVADVRVHRLWKQRAPGVFGGVADQRVDLGVLGEELLDEVAAVLAGGAGYEGAD